MDEYIKRTEALEITTRTCGDYAAAWSEIRKLPAADVAPVVHGRWVDGLECSICGADRPTDGPRDVIWGEDCKFCYSCGAKMDGGDNDAKSV